MAIYGECETLGRTVPVQIYALTRSGCDIASNGECTLALNSEMALWIGAIGPLAVISRQRDANRTLATFKEPLDPRILAHFATH